MKSLKSLAKAPLQTAGRAAMRSYYRWRTAPAVRDGLLNRAARKAYQSPNGDSAPLVHRLAADLRHQGIARTSLEELFPEAGILRALHARAASLRSAAVTREGKPFLKMFWNDETPVTWNDPYFRLALDPVVLAVVNAYFNLYGIFDYHSLDLTLPLAADADPFRSQRWHRDPEDSMMCKMFVYLTDVDEGCGPFIYVRGSQLGGRWRDTFPQQPPRGSYPPPEDVARFIPQDDMQICTGPAGTVLLADTSGLHRGGLAATGERLMYTAAFVTPASLRSVRHCVKSDEDFEREFARRDVAARHALRPSQNALSRGIKFIDLLSRRYVLY